MATIYRDKASGQFRIRFWFAGKQYHKSLDTGDEVKAASMHKHIEETLHDIVRERLTLPADADFWEFVRTGGRRAGKVEVAEVVTLSDLFDRYERGVPKGALDDGTLDTRRLHAKHLLRILGKGTRTRAVTAAALQRYVTERSEEEHWGRAISADTIKAEVRTFRAV
jgi:hypothetical protein